MIEQQISLYQKTQDIQLRNTLLEQSIPLIRKVAKQTRNIYANHMEFDDVVSIGILCMIECFEQFDIEKGLSFEAYAYTKIRFRIIDELGMNGFIPRRIRQESKIIHKAYDELANQLMREPSDIELAQYMNKDLNELSRNYQEMAWSQLLSFEDINESYGDRDLIDQKNLNPEQSFFKKEMSHQVAEALKKLSEKEQILISLYYYENCKLKEIGEIFDVSEARASQMHAQAIKKLKLFLQEELG
jgi:RNA polymerase sigma factor for flagellar operon FliA